MYVSVNFVQIIIVIIITLSFTLNYDNLINLCWCYYKEKVRYVYITDNKFMTSLQKIIL